MPKLYQLLLNSAEAALPLQQQNGSMPAGHNGPYHDPETPVRNSSHWLMIFGTALALSADERFRTAAGQAADYLVSAEAWPAKKTFLHRLNPKKDKCNGLIGQAWTLEALLAAAQLLERPELLQIAAEVFLLHPFDSRLGLWRRVEVNGAILSFDHTLNHQLWFAAAGGLLAPHAAAEIGLQVERFLDCLPQNLQIYPSGLIRHPLKLTLSWRYPLNILRYVRQQTANKQSELAYKAVGYHAFNLYALALLKQQYPRHPFWQSSKFEALWQYALSDAYKQAIEANKFGFSYNPPGFEMAFALSVFNAGSRVDQAWWLARQLQQCYDFRTHLMTGGTEDPMTHAARLYEAVRLPNLEVNVS